MSFVERFIVLCPYLGESTIGGPPVVESRSVREGESRVCTILKYTYYILYNYSIRDMYIRMYLISGLIHILVMW